MRCSGKALGPALIVFVFTTGAQGSIADTQDNPYQGIVERNFFGLKPPPPPPSNEPPKPPAPKITLTGITTILGSKQALLTVQLPPKPGEPAKQEPLILSEGERQGEVEVLEIDDVAYTIKVNDYGEVMTIALEKPKDSPKPNSPPGLSPYLSPYNPPGAPGGNVPPSPAMYPPPTGAPVPGGQPGMR